VLWRPLHEAAGGWFWWGAHGREAYLELYQLLYERLTYEYGLNNLLWVWNAQHHRWYPGDDRVDILGDDPYAVGHIAWLYAIDPARSIRFRYTRRASPNKMIAMTENDALPNLDFMWQQNTRWLMFVTWDRDRLLMPDPDNQPWGHLPVFSGRFDRASRVIRTYHDPRVITLDSIHWQ
jgi:mannan endo-1,4-beta-mannosidase